MNRDALHSVVITLAVLGLGYLLFFSRAMAGMRTEYGIGTIIAVTALALVVCYLAAVVFFAVRQKRMIAQIEKANDAVQFIQSGRLAEAQQLTAEIVARWPNAAKTVPVLAWNCSVVKYLSGDADTALGEMQAILESEPMRREIMAQLSGGLNAGMSHLCALRGRLDEAEQYLNTAKDVQRPNNESLVLLGEVLLLMRRKEHEKAVALASQRWAQIEAFLSTGQYRMFRIVWAFGLAQGGDSAQQAENAERIRELLGCARPHFARQFNYMGLHWPEMQAFLAEHGLWDA